MRKFLKLKSELIRQRAHVANEHSAMNASIAKTKQKFHDNLTSTNSLLSCFAAGAATGWFASGPKQPDIDVNIESNNANVDSASIDIKKSADNKKSFLSSTLMNQMTSLGVSLVIAEITKTATELVENARENAHQSKPSEASIPTE